MGWEQLSTTQLLFTIAFVGMVAGIIGAWVYHSVKQKPTLVRFLSKSLGFDIIFDERNNTYHIWENETDKCQINALITYNDPEYPVDKSFTQYQTKQTLQKEHPTAQPCQFCK